MAKRKLTFHELPQDCYNAIAGFTDGASLDSLTRASKRYYDAFAQSNFEEIRFDDTQGYLSCKLRAFLLLKTNTNMNQIRQHIRVATINLRYTHLDSSMAGDYPLANDEEDEHLVSRIVDALTRMTALQNLTLDLEGFSAQQSLSFSVQLGPTRRWDIIHTLRLNAPSVDGPPAIDIRPVGVRLPPPQPWEDNYNLPPGVFSAVLDHCDAKVLKAIHLYKWYGSREYDAVKRKYRDRTGDDPHNPPSRQLHKLHLYHDHPKSAYHKCTPTFDVDVLDSIIEDFPYLQWLILSEKPYTIRGVSRDRRGILSKAETLAQRVQSSRLKRLAFDLRRTRFHGRVIRKDFAAAFVEEGPREISEEEVDDWYSTLIRLMFEHAPRLEQLVIFDNFPIYHIGTRSSSGPMLVRRETLVGTKHSSAFPRGLM
ncbi:uncharacterized protein NECHADRAFT_79176 [Fusarium vanettenii 77-13-4]|uniref:F-box domain-containing protein n=1 Tax=Fusarium vanettenii (strain ATCC MYA-4622 / CBS 123669 / FGSC 9596 / NRRL 45880 / 77-13-4) TaxID=660122 RepID=C7YQP4_FUSV7|nr:uncharacterized protein NECHADRAFT_79176 [Fusarium vanettenii 77-13-4]EEU46058.1 predicted protein [Fusarium vanettenii 77-13-4]